MSNISKGKNGNHKTGPEELICEQLVPSMGGKLKQNFLVEPRPICNCRYIPLTLSNVYDLSKDSFFKKTLDGAIREETHINL